MVFLAVNAKAALSAALVLLAVVGGCNARLRSGSDEALLGRVSGKVTTETVSGGPGSAIGWQVMVVNHPNLQGAVTESGTYVISDVPAGTYGIKLVVPPQEDALPSCTVPDCTFPSVAVLKGTDTVNVDFAVSYMPAPPF